MRHLILKLSQIFSEKTLLFLGTLKVDIRPNYRPNIRPFLAEYSVSADTTFCTIGRSLIECKKEHIHSMLQRDDAPTDVNKDDRCTKFNTPFPLL